MADEGLDHGVAVVGGPGEEYRHRADTGYRHVADAGVRVAVLGGFTGQSGGVTGSDGGQPLVDVADDNRAIGLLVGWPQAEVGAGCRGAQRDGGWRWR